MHIVLFDIDGTLLLSGGAGLMALRKVTQELWKTEDGFESLEVHGLTDPLIVDQIGQRVLGRSLTDDEHDDFQRRYEEALPEFLKPGAAPFQVLAGAPELVSALREREDVTMGLATGNYEKTAYLKLQRAELDHHFDFGGFGSDSSVRAQLTQIAVDRALDQAGRDLPVTIVGDTIHDVRCAKAVQARCLAVATGNASTETLLAEGAEIVVEDLTDPRAWEAFELPIPGSLGN